MIESGIITPNGEKIIIPYYEVGSYLKKIIKNFISLSDENRQLFELFKQDYKTFEPDIDFCLCILNYKLYNPFLFDNKIIKSKENYLVDAEDENIIYKRCTDYNLKITNISSDNITECAVDEYGTKYDIDRKNKFNHDQLFKILLMQKMKDDKELYDDYVCYMKSKKELCPSVNSYFRNSLGYMHIAMNSEEEFLVIYNALLASNYTINLLKSIELFNKKVYILPEYIEYKKEKSR